MYMISYNLRTRRKLKGGRVLLTRPFLRALRSFFYVQRNFIEGYALLYLTLSVGHCIGHSF